jgi:hypothetical protein
MHLSSTLLTDACRARLSVPAAFARRVEHIAQNRGRGRFPAGSLTVEREVSGSARGKENRIGGSVHFGERMVGAQQLQPDAQIGPVDVRRALPTDLKMRPSDPAAITALSAHARDALASHVVECGRDPEGEPSQDRHLGGRIEALDVEGRIGFCVTFQARLLEGASSKEQCRWVIVDRMKLLVPLKMPVIAWISSPARESLTALTMGWPHPRWPRSRGLPRGRRAARFRGAPTPPY